MEEIEAETEKLGDRVRQRVSDSQKQRQAGTQADITRAADRNKGIEEDRAGVDVADLADHRGRQTRVDAY